jgi:hypothetical protein
MVLEFGPVSLLEQSSYLSLHEGTEWVRRWLVLSGGYIKVFDDMSSEVAKVGWGGGNEHTKLTFALSPTSEK